MRIVANNSNDGDGMKNSGGKSQGCGLNLRIRAASVFCASIIWIPAMGSETAASSAEATNDPGLQEIVVTAERKDTSLARTPVTVEVISAKTLDAEQIVSESDLRVAVPGLSVRANSNSNQLNYTIRGNTQDAFSGTRPGVLPYINDVQIGGPGGSSAFYDLSSVQVLKGPQGTLFGRSATGGAVLFTTTKPSDTFGGYVSVSGGDYAAQKYEGALNLPLVNDALLMRIAGFFQRRDGFQYNIYDDHREGDIEKSGGRLSLTGIFGPDIRNEFVADYYHSLSQSMVAVLSGLLPLAAPGTPPYLPLQDLYAGTATPQATATGIATLQALTGAPYAGAAAFYNAYFANPLHPNTGLLGVFAAQQARGPYTIDVDGRNLYQANNLILTDTTTYQINRGLELKNIFGFTHLKTFIDYETDGTPYAISQTGAEGQGTGYDDTTRQISDEFQALGHAIGGKLDYVAGVYVSDENYRSLDLNQFFDLFFGGELQNKNYINKNRTYAGYLNGTYPLNDSGLSIQVGTRYTSERVGLVKLPTDADVTSLGTPAPPGYSYNQSQTYNRLSWQAGLQDQLDPDWLLYITGRRAFKSGGFVGASPPKVGYADIAGDAFRAEQVTDTELGAKFQGLIAGVPVRLNTALFYQWILDSQRTAYTLEASGPAAVTVNVPTETAYGVEIEGAVRPTRWLNLGGSIDFIHPTFGSQPVYANGIPQIYNQVPDTPTLTGVVYAEVSQPISEKLSATLHGDIYAQKLTYTSPQSQNDAGTTVPGYGLVNFRFGVQNESAKWAVTANIKNAFNHVYYTGGLPAGDIYQINLLLPGEPRTYTVEARLDF